MSKMKPVLKQLRREDFWFFFWVYGRTIGSGRMIMARLNQHCERRMRGWLQITGFLVGLALSSSVFAGSTRASIKELLISEDFVYVYPSGGVVNPPSCHGSNGNYYSFSLNRPRAKEYLAGLLAAQAQGAWVIFYGTGNCDDQPNVSETLAYFSVQS